MSETWGVRVSTGQVTAARITSGGDGARTQFSRICAIRQDCSVEDALVALLQETRPNVAHVVADVSPVLDGWLTQPPAGSGANGSIGRVTVARVAPGPKTIAAPFTGWPGHLRPQLDGGWLHFTGGIDLHGGRAIPTDASRVGEVIRMAEQHGSVAICVSAMGALLDSEVEYSVAEQLLRAAPPCPVVLAHRAGSRRFLEREKSAILAASLLPAISGLLDSLETATARVGSTLSFAGADGARLSVEDVRAMPTQLLGSTNSLVAQGAAALAGVATAVILIWVGGHVRLLTMEHGALRTQMVRRSAQFGDLRFSQRHAVQSILTGPAAADLTRDLVENRPTVLARIAMANEDTAGFAALATLLARQMPEIHIVTEELSVLAALGARASLPQSEIVKYAVVSGSDEAQQMRHFLVQIAQGRVLAAADGLVELRTLADHHTPLSFLTPGPVLLHAHVVGLPTEAS